MMPHVSSWSGGVELEPTALYGLRVYTDGAVLVPHVDREETHALSLVLNVDQGSIREPWALEVDRLSLKVQNMRALCLTSRRMSACQRLLTCETITLTLTLTFCGQHERHTERGQAQARRARLL